MYVSVSGKGRKKRLLIEMKLYGYYTRLLRNIISTKIPVSNNITNQYLNI